MQLNFTDYARRPFVVQAVEITEDNIEEIATYVGKIEEKADGSKYIIVDNKLVPNIYRVYPGHFMTRMGDHTRCYTPHVFKQQFMEMSVEVQEAVDFFKK